MEPTHVGIILDSSVIITAERGGHSVHPVTLDIARLAGRIEGQEEAKGIRIAFEDLLIGATALHLGYAVATFNLRHFQNIPGLSVMRF